MTAESITTKEILDLENLNIGFIGPEGVGKTTIAKMLENDTQKTAFSTGDIVRGLAKSDKSEIGDKCRKILSGNVYLDGASLLQLVEKRLSDSDTENGFIIDGGFRTIEEINGFPNVLEKVNKSGPLLIFYLQAPKEVCIQRLLSGNRHRDDDTPEAIESRLSEFYKSLDERINIMQLQKGWSVTDIDANRPVEEVYESVLNILKFYLS